MAQQLIDIRQVAQLARLELDEAQLDKLQRELGTIVEYIDELKTLDVDGIEPTAHAMPQTNIWREDVIKESFPREAMLANAPARVSDDLIKVAKVLPGDEGN